MVYLDHAAATSMRPSARAAWIEASGLVGNPSSLHQAGRAARRLVEESRERIAAALRVAPSEVVFTSGGTESDNIGVVGTYRARTHGDPARSTVLVSAVEHKAVLEPVARLREAGATTITLPVDERGTTDPQALKSLLAGHADTTALVAVMWANNEVGAVQPIDGIAGVCADFGVPLHCDAVQALGNVPVDLSLPATSALSAHKVGGPFGVGLLLVRAGTGVSPLVHGGGHESGLRAGTLNAPGIAATAVAVEEAVTGRSAHAARVSALRDDLVAGIVSAFPDARVNSEPGGLPGLASVTFPGCEGDALMMLMDAAGVCVSTGSACTVGIPQPSHVLLAMGATRQDARSALRFSLGWDSTHADVAAALAALPDAVTRARRAGLVPGGRSG
jgi:cysteine desulfurase